MTDIFRAQLSAFAKATLIPVLYAVFFAWTCTQLTS